jgi:sarcosine oxidase gamma subunit
VAEENLSLALIAIAGRNRPTVTTNNVRAQLEGLYHFQPDEFTVSTYAPEDFMVRFASA